MESLVSYLLAAMLSWVPLHAHLPFESNDHARTRYESIARDAIAVAFDENETPLFEGPDARLQTALLMLSVASFESAYHRKVDDGTRRGDHGSSFCLMQIRVGQGSTREGWTGKQLVTDRKLCFRAGLHMLQASFAACRNLPTQDRLSAYASGHCYSIAQVSRSRVGRARSWFSAHAAPNDAALAQVDPVAIRTSRGSGSP